MQLDCAVTRSHQELYEAFRSADFKDGFQRRVVADVYGVEQPWERPAEYVVTLPAPIITEEGEPLSVTVRLSGVTRNGRPHKMHHTAIKALTELVVNTAKAGSSGNPVQVVVIYEVIEGDIEYPADSGGYTRVVEVPPLWINRDEPIVITKDELDQREAGKSWEKITSRDSPLGD